MKLVKPSEKYFEQLKELKKEFFMNRETRIQGSGSLEKYENLNEWLKSIKEIEKGLNSVIVPTEYYLGIADEEVVGTICIRKKTNREIEKFAGHIGYSIKPSKRKMGYATQMLSMLLDKYEKCEILVMAEKSNIPSNKVIIKNNGTLIETVVENNLIINKYIIKK